MLMPHQRVREDELLYMLQKLLELRLWSGTMWAAFSDSPTRYSVEQPCTSYIYSLLSKFCLKMPLSPYSYRRDPFTIGVDTRHRSPVADSTSLSLLYSFMRNLSNSKADALDVDAFATNFSSCLRSGKDGYPSAQR